MSSTHDMPADAAASCSDGQHQQHQASTGATTKVTDASAECAPSSNSDNLNTCGSDRPTDAIASSVHETTSSGLPDAAAQDGIMPPICPIAIPLPADPQDSDEWETVDGTQTAPAEAAGSSDAGASHNAMQAEAAAASILDKAPNATGSEDATLPAAQAAVTSSAPTATATAEEGSVSVTVKLVGAGPQYYQQTGSFAKSDTLRHCMQRWAEFSRCSLDSVRLFHGSNAVDAGHWDVTLSQLCCGTQLNLEVLPSSGSPASAPVETSQQGTGDSTAASVSAATSAEAPVVIDGTTALAASAAPGPTAAKVKVIWGSRQGRASRGRSSRSRRQNGALLAEAALECFEQAQQDTDTVPIASDTAAPGSHYNALLDVVGRLDEAATHDKASCDEQSSEQAAKRTCAKTGLDDLLDALLDEI